MPMVKNQHQSVPYGYNLSLIIGRVMCYILGFILCILYVDGCLYLDYMKFQYNDDSYGLYRLCTRLCNKL